MLLVIFILCFNIAVIKNIQYEIWQEEQYIR